MPDLLELLRDRGMEPRKVSEAYGGEYACACPGPICGGAGQDRFHVWPWRENPGGKAVGRFWCRRCEASGDTVAFLQLVEGMEFKEALAALGLGGNNGGRPWTPRRYQATRSLPQSNEWTPQRYDAPSPLWQEKAGNLLVDCQARLEGDSPAQAWLSRRGISMDAARAYGLGYNRSSQGGDRYRPRELWGLPSRTKDGKPARLWLPQGWVIPGRDAEGGLVHLRIRRREEDRLRFAADIKYLAIAGSYMGSLLLHPSAQVFAVVESGLDAILLASLFAGRLGVFCSWNSSARPDVRAHKILAASSLILGALDYDAGGDAQQGWWAKHYRQYRRLPALPAGAKDPGDAYHAGVDLYAWIRDALPRVTQIAVGLVAHRGQKAGAARRPQVPAPEPFCAGPSPQAPSSVSPQRGEATRNGEQAQVVEITRPNGQVIYATDDKASWHSYVAAGQVVLTGHEIQRVERAIAGEKDREACIDAICLVKTIFPGAYIRGGRQGK